MHVLGEVVHCRCQSHFPTRKREPDTSNFFQYNFPYECESLKNQSTLWLLLKPFQIADTVWAVPPQHLKPPGEGQGDVKQCTPESTGLQL